MTLGDPKSVKATKEIVDHKVPMRRLGTPNEIAESVIFLAGGRSSFVTGFALCVDGGYTER